ncbi:MAG: TatD family hydrolase [Treponema sp.]|nr:TatD family hydrolase [Treponema sp.]
MYDTHAHLSGLTERGIDPHQMLNELFSSGFTGIIDISLEPGDLKSRIKEFSIYPQVRFASGLWPWPASIENRETRTEELKQAILNVRKTEHTYVHTNCKCTDSAGLLEADIYQSVTAPLPDSVCASKICALGEFGLDHNWNGEGKKGTTDLEGERELMEMQMALAQELNLPVIIHSRDAAEETAEILNRYPQVRGVVHCFSYGSEVAKTFLDMGYYISFAGNLTYKNARNIQDACKLVPDDRLILETDCPYLAPVPYRGKPAHPGMVEEVYKKAAELRLVNIYKMAKQIQLNIKTLFG